MYIIVFSDSYHSVLYVSGEESAEQIKLRSERLGDIDNEFYLYAETNMQAVRSQVEGIKPDFLIIDSIQTIMSPEISGVQGSVSQVREVTAELIQIAKTNNIATFIVGHVTKEGQLAGPRMLEHMVDTVLYFEGLVPRPDHLTAFQKSQSHWLNQNGF